MRVTESLIYSRMSQNNNGAKLRLDKATLPLMTGLKHTRPSEDPMHAQRVERARRGAAEADRVRENIAKVEGYYQLLDTTLGDVTDTINELSTLAIQMANDSMTASERDLAATQVGQLLDYLHTMSNSRFDGRYLFSGRLEATPAYDDTFTYQGDGLERTTLLGDTATVELDVLGPSVFGDPGAGEVTVFQAALDLQNALIANDSTAISNSIAGLTEVHERVVAARSNAGMVLNDLMNFDSYFDDQAFAYRTAEADLVSADIAEAASELSFAEHVYEASLTTSRRINEMLAVELRF